MALNLAQLLQVGTASTTGAVQVGAGLSVDANGLVTLASGQPFPGTFINIPTSIPSSVPTTWQSPSNVIFATGCIELSKDNVTFTQDPISIDFGELLYIRWNSGVSCAGAPHGTTITGTITDGFYLQNAALTIDRIPNAFTLDDLSSQGLSTTITSNPSFLTGFNVPAFVTIAPGATLGNVQASIGNTAFVGIPTTGTTLVINPNQSIQLRGDTGPTNNTTYSASIQVGDAVAGVTTDTWDVTTVSVSAAIAQPSITAPPNGSTNLNPASNTPAGINLTASTYTPLNGAGAQTSSEWEVYEAIPQQPETSAITNVNTVTGSITSWTTVNGGFVTDSVNQARYGGGLWVAVGDSGRIASSPDAITWTQRLSGFGGSNVNAVAYGNGRWMIAGANGQIATSTDGINWTALTSGVTTNFLAIGYGNGTWIAAGQAAAIRVSTDNGATWTSVSPGGSGTVYGSIEYVPSSGFWVLTNNTIPTAILTSPTGFAWTVKVSTANSYGGIGQNGNNVFVGGSAFASSSTNGGTSFSVYGGGSTIFNGYQKAVTYGDGIWLAGGEFGALFYRNAPTGIPSLPWTNISANLGFTYVNSLAFGGGKFVATGPSGQIAYSNASSTTLTLADSTNLANMSVGDTVVEITSGGGAGDATGVISAINVAGPTITLAGSSGTWDIGSTVQDTTAPTVIPPAPTTTPPNPSKYTAITGSPFTDTSAPFNTLLIPQSSLETSSTYYSRVQYATTNSQAATSLFSAWSSFATAASFTPAPGTAMGGGYFGGQIDDGGIVYNLIVAPAATGQNTSGLAWKNAATAESAANTAIAQNEVYGFPMSQIGFTAGAATYPALHFARSVSAGGYNDWYLPAKNELEILYYNLKPTTTLNSTIGTGGTSGVNPNAVPARNTGYTSSPPPGQTSSTDFQSTGTQPFVSTSTAQLYWSSTQASASPSDVWMQTFDNGYQGYGTDIGRIKISSANCLTRAIRREYANAPVAIGDPFGGGFFAGQYVDGGQTWNLIVAPKATGEQTLTAYKTSNTPNDGSALDANNQTYGFIPQNSALTNGIPANYPAFNFADGLTIASQSDWYIPAVEELKILYYNLWPTWTSSAAFQAGGGEDLITSGGYWSASQDPTFTSQGFTLSAATGAFVPVLKGGTYNVRAVRRQLA